MMVRRGHYEKQDVVNALEIMWNGESYAEVARTSSFILRTLFKRAQGHHSRILIEGMRTHVNIGEFLQNMFIIIYIFS